MSGHHDQASGPLATAAEVDALSDVLEVVRLTGALFFLVDGSTPWVAGAPDSHTLGPAILPRAQHVVSYHVLIAGTCWCQMAGESPVRLDAGDVIVVPHGDAYSLCQPLGLMPDVTLDQALEWFRQMASGHLPFVVEEGGGGERLKVVCGFLGCDALPFNPVLAALPRILRVRRPSSATGDRLGSLIDLAIEESRDKRAGSRSVLLRIGELMFVEVVRRYLTTLTTEQGGWLAGLRDPIVGRALACLHKDSHLSWTIERLAREVGASRSVLAERFTHFVGEPPMHYLTRWRMQRAAGLLSDSSEKVAAIARQVGYDSEAAFSRAFKKTAGIAPAVWRSRASAALRPQQHE
jgi:AraC-like DNA-binding protein